MFSKPEAPAPGSFPFDPGDVYRVVFSLGLFSKLDEDPRGKRIRVCSPIEHVLQRWFGCGLIHHVLMFSKPESFPGDRVFFSLGIIF